MSAGVSIPRHWRCLGRRQSRLWGVGPTLALVALELGVFVLFGWLAGPFTLLGIDGLDAHGAEALPGPRVVVPALTPSGHQPSPTALATPQNQVQIEEVGLAVRFGAASLPTRGGQAQVAQAAAFPVAGLAHPSVGPGGSERRHAVNSPAAGRPGARTSHLRLARPQRAADGTSSRRAATSRATALRAAKRDSRLRAAARHHSRASRHAGKGHPDGARRRGAPLVHKRSR
ncbi:hypothetical protein GCM10009657_04010 [Oryzihumus leptocrescens]